MATAEEIALVSGEQPATEQTQTEVVEQQQEQVVANEPTAEERAIEMGWNPDYDGPNKKSAEEFLKIGEERAPILKKKLKEKEEQLATMQKSYQNMMETSAAAMKKQKEENERRINELAEVKKQAREDLDVEALEKAVNEENRLKQENASIERTAPPIDPSVQLWAKANEDFLMKIKSDPVMEEYSNVWAHKNLSTLQTLPPAERFEKVKEHMMQEFGHKFGNPNQQQAPKVQSTARTPTVQKQVETKLTVEQLPKTEQDAYHLLVKASRFKTDADKKAFKERYLENYKALSGQ